ncbi:hypothetical protein LTR84_010980 [Exophiala bonariae]|uniref:Transcription factor domain-containing protein n=1 Tax=Exophiala bonariae TaxID=1690606 RepID=A0AAV9NI97_9EURO|nr:hypothetical protein LTR84_010980 [Exophiala bonariae]
MLLATSSLSESVLFESGVPIDKNIVYQSHYTKAIQETASSPRIETVLLACLLFSCCEFMQGSIAAGLRHIYSGLNIIHEWSISNNETKESTLIIETLTPIFLAYIDKAPTYGIGVGDSLPCGARFASLMTPNAELPFVGRIDKIRRAHFALDGIGHHIARKADWRRGGLDTFSYEKVELLLADWQIEFDNFESQLTDIRRERLYTSIQLLRIAHTMLSMMLRASAGSADESIYQDFEKQFAWIVGQFDHLALAWAKYPSRKFISGREDIEYHFGYIAPLFFTATKCRNVQIRTAALWHLRHLKTVENNWTSCTAYEIASKIVEIEDSRSISKLSISPNSDSCETPLSYEEQLIRPIEALLSDNTPLQATLVYTSYPYTCDTQSSDGLPGLALRENVDLKQCPAASTVYWPLNSVLRIGGYQSGLIKPIPTSCTCGSLSQKNELLLLRPKAS